MPPKSAEDLVRVRWGTIADGLAGLMWRDGLSDVTVRYNAERLCLVVGTHDTPAEVVEVGPAPDHAPLVEPAAPAEPAPIPAEPPASSPVAATQGAPPKAPRSRAPSRSPR